MSEIIDLTNTDLGFENLGETWSDFILRCTPNHAKVFNDAYNLIAISFPDSTIDIDLTNLIIDESLETSDLMTSVRIYFIDLYCDALGLMGIKIDKDIIELNDLQVLISIINTIYMVDGMTDLIGVMDMVKNEELDKKDRFINIVKMVNPTEDFESLDTLLAGVEYNVLKGILIGLNVIDEDDVEVVDPSVTKRIKANKNFLAGKLGGDHIVNGGAPGLNTDVYLNLFINELGSSISKGPETYLNDALSLMIISSAEDSEIMDQFDILVESLSSNITDVYLGNKILSQVNLNE